MIARTLSGRLTAYSLLAFVLLLFLCFNLLFWSISNHLDERMDDDLIEDIEEFSLLLRSHGESRVVSEIDRETAAGGYETVFLILFDSHTREPVYSSDLSAWSGFEPSAELLAEQIYAETGPEFQTVVLNSQEEPARVVYGTISSNRLLVIGESTEEQQDIIELLKFSFFVVFLIAIPLAALLVWMVTRRSVSGIRRVSGAAMGIASGQMGMRVNAQDEVEEVQILADSFDTMAERVQCLVSHMQEMTDNIAHDLRSPLGRMRLMSESLLNRHSNVEQLQENAENTVAECDRLIHMINLSLDVAEAESGAFIPHTHLVDLNELVNDVCDLFESVAELKNVRLERRLPPCCQLHLDANSVQRLLSNLLDNAVKFTQNGGFIKLDMQALSNRVSIALRNSGEGIPEQSISYVFDRNYQVDSSRNKGGSGLGLSYARAVARAHGGDITVHSIPQQYTEFLVSLPVREHPASQSRLTN